MANKTIEINNPQAIEDFKKFILDNCHHRPSGGILDSVRKFYAWGKYWKMYVKPSFIIFLDVTEDNKEWLEVWFLDGDAPITFEYITPNN